MSICIVEGPDNSGKSTLIAHLASTLGLNFVPGEGPAKSAEEINERVLRYSMMDDVIFDRHPCVSQPMYNQFRDGPDIDQNLIDKLYRRDDILFVYCRGRPGVEGHVVKDHDSLVDRRGTRHEDTVRHNYLEICTAYDQWALKWAHVNYRIGDGYSHVRNLVWSCMIGSFTPLGDIDDFHKKFGLDYNGPPRSLPKDILGFRQNFMQEELDEYVLHSDAAYQESSFGERYPDTIDHAAYAHELEHSLDALVDEVYVALGTSYLHGFAFAEAWRRVHRANMMKIRATDASQSVRNSTHDVVKPAGWEPPSHIDLVERNDVSTRK